MPKLATSTADRNNRLAAPDGSTKFKPDKASKRSSPQREGDPANLLTEIPDPPEALGRESPYSGINHAELWWSKYWELLIASRQAVPDFIPSLLTLCSLRQDLCEIEEGLREYKIHTKVGANLAKSKLAIAKTTLALEGTFGFTLATHSIRQQDVRRNSNKQEDEAPRASNSLASRHTENNPFDLDSEATLFNDDE